MEILDRPYTVEELKEKMDGDCYVTGNVRVDINDIIPMDFEGFLDFISNLLTGTVCLMDINYKAVALEKTDVLIFEVSGDVSNIIDWDEEEGCDEEGDCGEKGLDEEE